MTYVQERAIALYHKGTRRHKIVRDVDLLDLQDAFPSLRPVFEEMQRLRHDAATLQDYLTAAQEDKERGP